VNVGTPVFMVLGKTPNGMVTNSVSFGENGQAADLGFAGGEEAQARPSSFYQW